MTPELMTPPRLLSQPSRPSRARQALLALAACWLPLLAQADPQTLFVPYEGSGNLLVFDAAAGTGGWTGQLLQSAFPAVPTPLSLISVVLFTLDPVSLALSGSVELTDAADLGSTLTGTLSGQASVADILTGGGQFSLDYTLLAGTGAFAGFSGYGLAFVDFDPAGLPDNYAEAGTLVLTVPEPGTLALALAGLALLAPLTAAARRRPPNDPRG